MYAESKDIQKMDLKQLKKALRGFKRNLDDAEDIMGYYEGQVYKCESLISEVKERIKKLNKEK